MLRQYITRRIGEELFRERQKREQTLAMVARILNINLKFADKAELGSGRIRWILLALLLKYYQKQIEIKLVDLN